MSKWTDSRDKKDAVPGEPNLLGPSASSSESIGEKVVPASCAFCGTPCGVAQVGTKKFCDAQCEQFFNVAKGWV